MTSETVPNVACVREIESAFASSSLLATNYLAPRAHMPRLARGRAEAGRTGLHCGLTARCAGEALRPLPYVSTISITGAARHG
jgi:hypothetical protein